MLSTRCLDVYWVSLENPKAPGFALKPQSTRSPPETKPQNPKPETSEKPRARKLFAPWEGGLQPGRGPAHRGLRHLPPIGLHSFGGPQARSLRRRSLAAGGSAWAGLNLTTGPQLTVSCWVSKGHPTDTSHFWGWPI